MKTKIKRWDFYYEEKKEVIQRCVCMRVCVDVCNRDIYSSSFFEEVTS